MFFFALLFSAGCVLNRSKQSSGNTASNSNTPSASAQESNSEISNRNPDNDDPQYPELTYDDLAELTSNQNVNATELNVNDAPVTNVPQDNTNEDGEVNDKLNVNTAPTTNDPQARTRDEQRVVDIKSLQAALRAHFEADGSYPDILDGLVPRFLQTLPQNSTPGGRDYIYTPIGSLPAQFYDLSYELEVGTDEVSGGSHVATPKGLMQP